MSHTSFRDELFNATLAEVRNDAPVITQVRNRPLRILMICTLYTMPYRIARCAAETGAEIYVLGNEGSTGFNYSRFCKKFVQSPIAFNGMVNQEIADEINRYVAAFEIDMVMAGDAPSTRTLSGVKDRIAATCFPMPTLEQFDMLNNKWEFTQMCGELDIATPPSRLFQSREELLKAIEAGEVNFPCMAKALSMDGSHGIYQMDEQNARFVAGAITFSPILVQDFIDGEDIGASVYCKNGEIQAYILHRLKRGVYSTFDNDAVRHALTRIARKTGINGVYNFDMRLNEHGEVFFLECNPRFFFKINLSMVAGVNFVAAGLPGSRTDAEPPKGSAVRKPKAIALALATKPWTITSRDLKMLGHLWADPVAYVREVLGYEREPTWGAVVCEK